MCLGRRRADNAGLIGHPKIAVVSPRIVLLTGRVYRTSPDSYDLFPQLRPACRAPTPRRRTPGCAGRRTCNVNLDNLRWDRPDIDCEPQQARGIRRNLQLDKTVAVTPPGSSGDHTLPFHQQAANWATSRPCPKTNPRR